MMKFLSRHQSIHSVLKSFNKTLNYEKTIQTFESSSPTNKSKSSERLAKKEYFTALKNLHLLQSPLSKILADLSTQQTVYSSPPPLTNLAIYVYCIGFIAAYVAFMYTDLTTLIKNKTSSMNILSSTHYINTVKSTNIKFKDVLGIDECKSELEELVSYLKNPSKYKSVGAKLPKGVLLTGEPGTGKTLLAKAVAGEAGVEFFYCSGSDFDEMYVGLGSRRMRELFRVAKSAGPCILFIDEIDCLASKRSLVHGSSSRQTLNQLLIEMDGFSMNDSVIVIAATNFPESLDSAIMRSGRFDKVINLPLPDIKGRIALFNLYTTRVKCEANINCEVLAKQTTGMTGADISNIVNIAALHAVDRGRSSCTMKDFEVAIDRMKIGMENKSFLIDKEEIRATAIHEVGHALVAYYTKGAGHLHKITILPRGPSLGHASILEKKDKTEYSVQDVLGIVDTMMGGRAAEDVMFGKEFVTLGCSSDLRNATLNTYRGIFGGLFKDRLGALVPKSFEEVSNEQRDEIDKVGMQILRDSYERAVKLLAKRKKVINGIADELMEKETMDAEEIVKCIKRFE